MIRKLPIKTNILLHSFIIFIIYTQSLYSNELNYVFSTLPVDSNKFIYDLNFSNDNKKIFSFQGGKNGFETNYQNSKLKIKDNYLNKNIIEHQGLSFKKYLNNLLNNSFNKLYYKINFDTIEEVNNNCFEGRDYLIKSIGFNCKPSAKTTYENTNNSELFEIKGETLGYEIGLSKTNFFWSTKSTTELGLLFNKVNYKTFYSQTFNILNSDYKIDFPNDGEWWINTLKFSHYKSNSIYKNWGLGYGITGYYNFYKGLNLQTNKRKKNIKIDLLLSRKFPNNLYFAAGVTYRKQFLLGEENIYYVRGKENLFGNNSTSYNVRIGYIFKQKNSNKQDALELMTSDSINSLLQEKKLTENMSLDNINKFEKNNKNTFVNKLENKSKLFSYAINFAKEYDIIKL